MRFFTTLILLIALTVHLKANTYYISNNGDDLNDGLSIATPFKTFQPINALILQVGDSILLESGHWFTGTLMPAMNGPQIKRLYIGIYNGSEKAVISGGFTPYGWSVDGDTASVVVDQHITSVYFNEQRQTPARFPDFGFLPIASVNGTIGFSSSGLTQINETWNGATARIRSSPNEYVSGLVDQYNSGALVFSDPISNAPTPGSGFYLDQSYKALSTFGEWYYDTATHKLSYLTNNPSALTNQVVAVSEDYGLRFMASCDSIIIENLDIRFNNRSGIYFSSTVNNTLIRNCAFNYGNDAGILIDGIATKVDFHNNTFNDFLTNGIHVFQLWYSRINHNTFTNIGAVAGQGRSGYFQYTPIFSGFMAYSEINDNTIKHFGNSAIKCDGPFNSFRRNYIEDGMLCTTTSGALNFYGDVSKELIIEDNFILNIKGNQDGLPQYDGLICGILMNGLCHNNTIHHNTIANCGSYGIWITTGNYEHTITGNLIYNNRIAQLSLNDFYGVPGSNKNHVIKNNIFYCLSGEQVCLEYETLNPENLYSVTDSNYYCNPYNYTAVREKFVFEEPATVTYPLPAWQKRILADSNSIAPGLSLNRYTIDAETENELISNGNFTANFDDWELYADAGMDLLLDNDIGMDGGCVKVLLQDTALTFAQINSKAFSLINNQFYRLRYSVFGDQSSYMNTSVYLKGGDYHPVGLDRFNTYITNRTEKEFIFRSTEECASCAVRLSMFKGDSLLVLDNISLRQVSVSLLDSTLSNRLILNYSDQQTEINLNDTTYFDLNGNTITGTFNLPAYSSYVLVPQQIIFNSINNPVLNQSTIQVYPNPATDHIQIILPEYHMGSSYEVINISGQLVKHESMSSDVVHSIDLSHITPGIYILRVINERGVYTQRLVKL
ncbi:MAG: T9SS type A sorting domain-containing protein [Bacteroidota bacterium]